MNKSLSIQAARKLQDRCFVYMLLCREDGPIYVKVGQSREPLKRLSSLRGGCPVIPRQFAIAACPTLFKAKLVERALHIAFDRWAVSGEWFKLDMDERPTFNTAWRSVFATHTTRLCQLRWTQMPVNPTQPAGVAAKSTFFKRLMPGLPGEPSAVRRCLKTG